MRLFILLICPGEDRQQMKYDNETTNKILKYKWRTSEEQVMIEMKKSVKVFFCARFLPNREILHLTRAASLQNKLRKKKRRKKREEICKQMPRVNTSCYYDSSTVKRMKWVIVRALSRQALISLISDSKSGLLAKYVNTLGFWFPGCWWHSKVQHK